VWGEERVRVGALVGMGGVWCVGLVEWKVGSGVDGTGWGTGGMMGGGTGSGLVLHGMVSDN